MFPPSFVNLIFVTLAACLVSIASKTAIGDGVLVLPDFSDRGEVRIGKLFNAFTDKFIPEGQISLWPSDLLDSLSTTFKQPSTNYDFLYTDTIRERAYALDIYAELGIKILFIPIPLGSLGLLATKRSTRHELKITLKHEVTTKFEELSMEAIARIGAKEEVRRSNATHIVTGILYGARAFIDFHELVDKTTDELQLRGSLSNFAKGMTSLRLDDVSGSEGEYSGPVRCTYNGDYPLALLPRSDVKQVMDAYRRLPSLLEDAERPVKYWLHPIADFYEDFQSQPIGELGKTTQDLILQKLDQLDEIMTEAGELQEDAKQNSVMISAGKLDQLLGYLRQFKEKLQAAMAKLTERVRVDSSKGPDLVKQLKSLTESSPFAHESIRKWVETKVEQVKILKHFTNVERAGSGEEAARSIIKYIDEGSKARALLEPKVQIKVIANLFAEVAPANDNFLTSLKKFIDENYSFLDASLNDTAEVYEPPVEEAWHDNFTLISQLKAKMKRFYDSALANHDADPEGIKFYVCGHFLPDGAAQPKIEVEFNDVTAADSHRENVGLLSAPRNLKFTLETGGNRAFQLSWEKPEFGADEPLIYDVSMKEWSKSEEKLKNASETGQAMVPKWEVGHKQKGLTTTTVRIPISKEMLNPQMVKSRAKTATGYNSPWSAEFALQRRMLASSTHNLSEP